MAQKKVLIVGGGVSGICLATELASRGTLCTVIDDVSANVGSSVAGAIVNPVFLKFQKLVWRAEEFYHASAKFYQALHEKSESPIYFPMPIGHLLHTVGDENDWSGKLSSSFEGAYDWMEDDVPLYISTDRAVAQVNASFRIDPLALRESMSSSINIKVLDVALDYGALSRADNGFVYKDVGEFTEVIFAEGAGVVSNPWFRWLPIDPTKGQLATIEWPHASNMMWHKKFFLLPIGSQQALTGATYGKLDGELELSDEADQVIKQGIQEFYRGEYHQTGSRIGVRAVAKDKRPIIGEHPEESGLYVINGMGSRGFLMAPLIARWMADLILDQHVVPDEVNLQRWMRRWYQAKG